MSIRKALALTSLLILLGASSALAQNAQPEKTFNLERGAIDSTLVDDTELEAEVHIPQIKPGQLEATLTLGFLNLATTLLEHDQIIYKYDREYTSWGDVNLQGEAAFNPILRLNYNLNRWFAIEPMFSLSVSEYLADVTNRSRRKNEEGAPIEDDPELGEFDAENRSVISLGVGANALVYPFNIGGSRESRLHPFLTGGMTRTWLSLNSNYTDAASASWMYNIGGGLRFIADELVSIRLEVVYNTTTVQFMADDAFDVLDEGTLVIPVLEYPENADGGVTEQRVTEFKSEKISGLSWAVGFMATF